MYPATPQMFGDIINVNMDKWHQSNTQGKKGAL